MQNVKEFHLTCCVLQNLVKIKNEKRYQFLDRIVIANTLKIQEWKMEKLTTGGGNCDSGKCKI